MASTKLVRKAKKNKARANNRKEVLKQIQVKPVVKNVDVEELKAQFKK